MPVMIQLVAAKEFQPDPMRVLTQIGLFVVLPLVVAQIAKRHIMPWARQLKFVAVLGLATAIFILIYQSTGTFSAEGQRVFVCAAYLLCASITLASMVSKFSGVARRERIAIICEVGTQNAAQAMAIASSVFQSTTMAMPGLAYAILMYPMIAATVIYLRRNEGTQ
jgi:bile acid:Na+ symporter, BASS family